ncbi:uncharacterized protein B0I36DRAFT_345272 [Microdochium trichocladiopsis]|uniref:DUF8035 domain-containing protein n=1 Tax=Microdochium trichocladiopsis TaxID=1682393 RepID=A0A9P9BXJ5_9PEZI|nr:uncharacterized protein B0I36DRAFT_345272 [Microdochium trichocladiopsis]KAH7037108.1 hypothetical protein B0I36DRAFT_345272 [Microdochium trichocladiopsis]
MSSYRGSGRSDYDEVYERRTARRSPPRRAPVREYEDVDVRVRERDRSRERVDRTPAFLREDARRTDAGALVLRAREVETIDRRRVPSPSPPPTVRSRSIRPRYVQRSPSPSVHVDVDTRVIERRRPRSPTPEREREVDVDLRIVHREKERAPTPEPPPPPPEPPVIRGPTIEREVITHYRDIDHGVIRVRQPSPSPPPRPARVTKHETDIDINISRHDTDVEIQKRARSRSRPRPRFYDDEDIHIDIDRNRIHIDEHSHETRRRALSEVRRPPYEDEANYITSKIDSRGRMGEAWHGATKDWTIVDVPPGTERVQMDGVGGGGAEVTWQRYNGVRRAKFIPERDGTVVSSNSIIERGRDLDHHHHHDHELSVDVHINKNHSHERSRSRAPEVVEEIRDRRISIRDGKSKKDSDMWTEITKDLVVREAIEKRGYAYEETEFFFYVMQYLAYEDVLELVEMSDRIRRRRREKERYVDWERDAFRDDWERKSRHYHSHTYGGARSSHWDKYDTERLREHDVTYERLRY